MEWGGTRVRNRTFCLPARVRGYFDTLQKPYKALS